jgi:hypothetical protein
MKLKISLLIATLIIFINILATKSSTCSISTISIPTGTSEPVIVYTGKNHQKSFRLTVLEKDHLNEIEAKGNLFYSDKKTGELWYSDNEVDENNKESLRDIFSLCRTLNIDNKKTQQYRKKGGFYARYQTNSLPSNLAYRKAPVAGIVANNEEGAEFLRVANKNADQNQTENKKTEAK